MEENKQVVPYNFEGMAVRVVKDEKGEPWFVAKDVCDILGYVHTYDAVKKHCKYSEILKPRKSHGMGLAPRGVYIIPESDLYRLIMRSTMNYAEHFQAWVVEVVLPSIRKTGGYIQGEEHMSEDELVLKAMQVLQRKVEVLHQQVEEQHRTLALKSAVIEAQKPKVESFDHLMNSEGLFNFRNTARILGIGEDVFMRWLRSEGYLTDEGHYNRDKMGNRKWRWANTPYKGCIPDKKFRDMGLFRVKTYVSPCNGYSGLFMVKAYDTQIGHTAKGMHPNFTSTSGDTPVPLSIAPDSGESTPGRTSWPMRSLLLPRNPCCAVPPVLPRFGAIPGHQSTSAG
ncbi:MAG: BRO family protein, partial [Syntrophobacteraceae bacterium]|nr:phage antirepressor KilAC domain-containing protein [Desulfobacteraceae bacterium]